MSCISLPNMKISLRTDVTTSGSHEGLLISTGFFTSDNISTDNESPIGTHWHQWVDWYDCFSHLFGGPGHIPLRQFLPSSCGNSTAGLLVPLNAEEHGKQWQQQQKIITSPAEGKQMKQINVPLLTDCQKSKDGVPIAAGLGPSISTDAETLTEKIKLNLFDGNDGGDPSDKRTAELIPLTQHSKGPSFLDLGGKKNAQQMCQRQQSFSPLLCDTTTTTTTIEVFRAKPDNAHFFQIPKGPLSRAKQSVELIAVGGPDYERMDRSETQFSDRINSSRYDSASKSLQWSEDLPHFSLPSIGQPNFSPTDNEHFVTLSPSGRYSTPLHFEEPQRVTTISPQQMRPIASSPLPLVSADGLTTVLRRQRCDKNERFFRQPKNNSQSAEEEAEKKVPPRPPKSRDKMKPFWEDNKAPPRPPKPTKYIRKSKSAGFVNPNYLKGNAIKTSSSANIFKLYQTRDCLGRVVYEW